MKVAEVTADVSQLADILIQSKSKDANLTYCLAYLVARSLGHNVVSIEDMAAKVNVSLYSAERWVRRLAGMGLISLKNARQGAWRIEIGVVPKAEPGTLLAQFCEPQVATPSEKSRGKNDIEKQGSPPTTPPVRKSIVKHKEIVLTISQKHRYEEGIAAWQGSLHMKGRGEIATALTDAVRMKTFDGLDIAKEVFDADAWLAQSKKKYRDMNRFMMNWFRTAARNRKRSIPSNANPAPINNKYDGIGKNAKKKEEEPVPEGRIWA